MSGGKRAGRGGERVGRDGRGCGGVGRGLGRVGRGLGGVGWGGRRGGWRVVERMWVSRVGRGSSGSNELKMVGIGNVFLG